MNINTRAKLVWWLTWAMWKWFGVSIFLFKEDWDAGGWKRVKVFIPVFIFVVSDMLFNFTVGSFIFWERPHNFLFTARLEDHKAGVAPNSTPESKKLAIKYCKLLGQYDPGHC